MISHTILALLKTNVLLDGNPDARKKTFSLFLLKHMIDSGRTNVFVNVARDSAVMTWLTVSYSGEGASFWSLEGSFSHVFVTEVLVARELDRF